MGIIIPACITQGSPEKQNQQEIYIHTYAYGEGFILRNWLTEWWGLASLKFVRQASKLEMQVRIDVAYLRLNSAGKQSRNLKKVSMLQP